MASSLPIPPPLAMLEPSLRRIQVWGNRKNLALLFHALDRSSVEDAALTRAT
jgi:hypothetical protein